MPEPCRTESLSTEDKTKKVKVKGKASKTANAKESNRRATGQKGRTNLILEGIWKLFARK